MTDEQVAELLGKISTAFNLMFQARYMLTGELAQNRFSNVIRLMYIACIDEVIGDLLSDSLYWSEQMYFIEGAGDIEHDIKKMHKLFHDIVNLK